MVWTAGLQLIYGGFYTSGTGNKRRFADQINSTIKSERGNKVNAGCAPTVGAATDLSSAGNHLNVASGTVLVDGTPLAFAGGNLDLSTAQATLSSGETMYVLVTIYDNASTATLRATSGTIATDGNQEPPETPEDEVDIAIVYLTYADTTMDSNQIGDWRYFTAEGTQLGDGKKSYWGDFGELSAYHDGTDSILQNNTGSLILYGSGGSVHIRTGSNFRFLDKDDSDAYLLDLNSTTRTLIVGASADRIIQTSWGEIIFGDTEHSGSTVAANSISNFPLQYNAATGLSGDFYPIWGFSTTDNNPSITKVGMYLEATGGGYEINIATSSSFVSGLNIIPLTLKPTGGVHNPQDNAGFYTGAGDDLRMYHSGSVSYIENSTGSLYFRNTSANLIMLTGRSFVIQDDDAGDIDLFDFDTTARTYTVGATGADNVDSTFYGDFTLSDVSNRMSLGTTPSDRFALDIRPTITSTTTHTYGMNINSTLTGGANNSSYHGIILQGTLNNASQTITDWYGLRITNPTVTLGTITNNYGLYIESQTSGTNDYAIYSVGGDVYLGGISNATTDTDKFLVDDGGIIKYRTGAELLSDLDTIHPMISFTAADMVDGAGVITASWYTTGAYRGLFAASTTTYGIGDTCIIYSNYYRIPKGYTSVKVHLSFRDGTARPKTILIQANIGGTLTDIVNEVATNVTGSDGTTQTVTIAISTENYFRLEATLTRGASGGTADNYIFGINSCVLEFIP